MVTLQTHSIRVEIDVQYGATITGVFDRHGTNALAHYDWETPLPARTGLSYGNDDLDLHSGYRGGWQETFPNAGLSSSLGDVPLPFHGEATTARWTIDQVSESSCRIHVPSRLPLILRRTMTIESDRPVLRVEGVVENVGEVGVDFVWGHHPAFPAVPGARIDYPRGARVRPDAERNGGYRLTATTWPNVMGADGAVDVSIMRDEDLHQLFYLDQLAAGWAALRQPGAGVSVGLAWDVEVMPYSWLWIQRGDPHFPFYGRASMVAIEAQTAWPYDGLAPAAGRGMAHRLAPGERLESWYTMALFDGDDRPIVGVARDGSLSFGDAA